MSNPFLLNQGQQKENSGGEGFYLGTVADVSSDGVKILFDGQSEATEKRYKQLNTGITLATDDRIVAMKISGSYVVLGRIAYNQSGGGGSVDVDDELDETSENPVQNKVITHAIEDLQDDVSTLDTAVGKKVLFFTGQAVAASATTGQIMRIPASGTNSAITTDTVVLECTFAISANITSDVTWESYSGYITFTGTTSAATTANVTLGTKGN